MSLHRSRLSVLSAAALALVSVVGTAHANVITGGLWHVPEAVVDSATGATLANVPGTAPDVAFSVNSPFSFSGTSVSVGTWLASSSAFNIVENTAGTLASLMDNGTDGTIVKFTGFVTVTNGETFTVIHDDGLTLTIDALDVISAPGPTAPAVTTATYTGPTGTEAFTLVYAECCGGPAVLQIDLPLSNVPEPMTLAVVGVGLTGLGVIRRRRAR